MKSISQILKDVYCLEFSGLNILECGANQHGDETSSFDDSNNCWYVEANQYDYNILKNHKKNSLNLALSDKDGRIKFLISSHIGNSSCEYSEEHLQELKSYNSSFEETEVECVSYQTLLNRLKLVFDILVLDIEGHEKTVLESWKNIDKKLLPKIIVIECGYDWQVRLSILKQLGFTPNCYYFNNCYLSRDGQIINEQNAKIYNNEWRTFIWNNKTIYVNDL